MVYDFKKSNANVSVNVYDHIWSTYCVYIVLVFPLHIHHPLFSISFFLFVIQLYAEQRWEKLQYYATRPPGISRDTQCSIRHFLMLCFFSVHPTFTHHFSEWQHLVRGVILLLSKNVIRQVISCACYFILKSVCVCGTWLTHCLGTVGDRATCCLIQRPLNLPP